jgi:hypothetical protein
MKACPFCRGRATKLVSLSTGLITCQQCGRSYEVEGAKEAVASAIAHTNAEFEHRFIHGTGPLHGIPAGLLGQRMRVVCSRGCAAPRRDKEQEHPGICVCGGFLTDEPEGA